MRRVQKWSTKSSRSPLSLRGTLTLQDGRSISVTITAVSHLGCKLATTEMLPVSEIVEVESAGRESARARVHWSMFGKAGLLFLKEPGRAKLAGGA